MAVSTHRWRPEIGIKSGYTRNKKLKKLHGKEKTKCIIECKFENSLYFAGVKNPILDVYKIEKASPTFLNRFFSENKFSESAFQGITDRRMTKKLYVSEHVEATNVHLFTKLNDPFVRSYIINDEKGFVEEAMGILEIIKTGLPQEEWNSLRIIVIPKSCDISADILRKDRVVPILPNIKSDNQSDEEDRDFNYGENDDETFTDDTRSTNTTMDEESEERQRNRIATSKFRDSRIILANRPKPFKPEIDPVEKCFLALTKLFEDHVFSAAKGLKEVNMEIIEMTKLSSESLERISNDSIDINFQMK